MYLTRVELSGFKSFADKTVFDFDEGITAILGPNGCGKSNVVDAIKWVLGETSAKNLRGNQMQDVIFAGSERRKPLGMAEVHLHFDNTDGKLPVEYNEVCISRRLYRSGESEYLINKQPCRKRDIRDMLLDTGVGTSAYSVIEQGKVEALLQAKPHERRLVFEEAAGISKYKQRRKETLARLDRTNQYLFRVNDIVEEIEKNIRRVSRQAASARRFHRLKTEMDLVKTHFYARRWRNLNNLLENLQKEHQEIDQLFGGETTQQADIAKRIAELTQQEMNLAKEVESQERVTLSIQEELGKIQAELSAATERLDSICRREEESGGRAEQLKTRMAAMTEEKEAASAEQEKAASFLSTVLDSFKALEDKRESMAEGFRQMEGRVVSIRREIQSITDRRNNQVTDAARLESEAKGLKERAGTIETRKSEVAQQEQALAQQVQALTGTLDGIAETVQQFNASIQESKEKEAGSRSEADRRNQQISDLKSRISGRESRRATLEDLENNLAGTHKGVKAVLTAWKEGAPACASIRGMIADLMSVPQDVAVAIETTVGTQAQDIVVETARGAQDCIQHLKETRAGRATFLPLDRIRPRRRVEQNILHLTGVVGEAVDLVEFDEALRPAMEYALAGVLIVSDLSRARELAGSEARGIRLVTLDGEVINPHGAMTGGVGHANRGGLITRKAEMDALTKELEEMDAELTRVTRYRDAAIAAIRTTAEETATLEKALAEAAQNGQRLERDLSVRTSEMERVCKDRGELDSEQQRIAESLQQIETRSEECKAEQVALQNQLTEKEGELQQCEEAEKTQRTEVEQVTEELAALREQRATAQSRADELTRRLSALERDLEDRGRELADCVRFTEDAVNQKATLQERIDTLNASERELLVKRDASRESGSGTRQRLQSLREQLSQDREQERAIQKRLNEIMEAQNNLKLKENESKLKLEALTQKAFEELQIENLGQKTEELEREEAAAQAAREAAVDETEEGEATGEVLPSLTDDGEIPVPHMTEEQMQTLIHDLTVKLERIGHVNMYAIEELTELEARAAFLKAEQEDLETAAGDLLEVIERLNGECSRRFEETFVAVRENFQELFRKLFGGGKADLILEMPEGEGADALDAGIDIIARPPGKEPKSISLLSGGEKALCAVALLFAIFRSKPSPFCILDEVDGPLDESNIDRFMTAVRDFAEDTQFILISHAKRTMSMTDTIYGVTQQEPGISTKYSLRFKEAYQEEGSQMEEREAVAAG